MKSLIRFNDVTLSIGRFIAWICLAIMVGVILTQVFFRFFLDALPWTEEAARALMIWMTMLIAPTALRWGGFVAIDTIKTFVRGRAKHLLAIILYAVALIVLGQMFLLSLDFAERGLRVRMATFQFTRFWVFVAMPIGLAMMVSVTVELIWIEFRKLRDPHWRHDQPLPGFMKSAE